MKVKITEKNAVLKTAKTFMEEDIGIEIDESLLGGESGGGGTTGKSFTLDYYSENVIEFEYSIDGGAFVNGSYSLSNLTGVATTIVAHSPGGFLKSSTVSGGTITYSANTSYSGYPLVVVITLNEDNAVINLKGQD